MKARTGWALGLTAVGILVAAGAGVAMTRPKAPPSIPIVAVARGDVEESLIAPASTQPSVVVDVGAELPGKVEKMYVRLGQQVRAGQKIAEIESRQLENRKREAEFGVLNNQQNIRQFTFQVDMDRADAKRYQTIVDKGLGGQEKLERALANVRRDEFQLEVFKNQLNGEQTRLELAQLRLDKATVRAPISGMVAEVVTHEGMTVNNFDSVPVLVKIAKMDTMLVRAVISEADIMRVRPGQTVSFSLPQAPSRQYVGKLADRREIPDGDALQAERKLSRNGVYYYATFEAPNPDGGLLPGMTVDVRILLGRAKDVPVLPVKALGPRDHDGRFTVHVLEANGQIGVRHVQLGLRGETVAEIKDGLRLGERVVLPQREAS